MCVRGSDCLLVHQITIEGDMLSFFERIECSCPNQYDLNCKDKNYCGKSLYVYHEVELNKNVCLTVTTNITMSRWAAFDAQSNRIGLC